MRPVVGLASATVTAEGFAWYRRRFHRPRQGRDEWIHGENASCLAVVVISYNTYVYIYIYTYTCIHINVLDRILYL